MRVSALVTIPAVPCPLATGRVGFVLGRCPGAFHNQALLTEFPVQKIGHLSHGGSRERTHVLRYGFRTISGKTGGVRVEALARATAAAPRMRFNRILNAPGTRGGEMVSSSFWKKGRLAALITKRERVVFGSHAVVRNKAQRRLQRARLILRTSLRRGRGEGGRRTTTTRSNSGFSSRVGRREDMEILK